ncbi:MAG: ParB/RepB/Spo0J family partition protein [Cyanothece sp. SIO1E1]|nr:ParB/RepB/Spo0J family partition protein [Cyanothece sp. SIO1E1]
MPKRNISDLLGQQFEEASEQPQISRGKASTLPIEQIQDRESDTRTLNPKHVDSLVESIRILGLIEPLVVDKKGVLLAGGHRRAAIAIIREKHPRGWGQHFPGGVVPVRMMDFSSEDEPDRALQIEVAENEQRRDYSPSEVKIIADRLRKAGYTETVGRPKAGQKALKPALSVVVSKSIRQVKRYLSSDLEKPASDTINPEIHLRRAIANLEKWSKDRGKKHREIALSKKLPEIIEVLKAGLGE